jgi:hypothetical protein
MIINPKISELTLNNTISCGNYEEMIIYMDTAGTYKFKAMLRIDEDVRKALEPESNSLYPLIITVACGMTLLIIAFFVFLLRPIIDRCKEIKK